MTEVPGDSELNPSGKGTASPIQSPVADWLRKEAVFPEGERNSEFVETHISQVFLTDRFAYKLKRPVRFDFLDFSTPELRRRFCFEELRLNRRLTQGVYLEVLPILAAPGGRFEFGPPIADPEVTEAEKTSAAPAIDWLLRMKRLPAENSLERRLQNGSLPTEAVRTLGAWLAEHFAAFPSVSLGGDDYRRLLSDHVRGNHEELLAPEHALEFDLVRRIHQALLRWLELSPEMFVDRPRQGRIADGHGDLRPEHVYFLPEPAVIDCIEFSPDFRRVDRLDDLCFLAMECDRLEAEHPPTGERAGELASHAVGDSILAAYQKRAADYPRPELIAWYKAYRACVRAKVQAIRGEQLPRGPRQLALSAAVAYLNLADRYCRELGGPLAIAVGGLPGSGKSTLAEGLGKLLDLEILSSDAIRREIFPPPASQAGFNEGIYSAENRARVYEELLSRASERCRRGLSIVCDASFASASQRAAFFETVRRSGAKGILVQCECSEETAAARVARRVELGNSLSDARPELLPSLQAAFEKVAETSSESGSGSNTAPPYEHEASASDALEYSCHCATPEIPLSTEGSPEEVLQNAVAKIGPLCLGEPGKSSQSK